MEEAIAWVVAPLVDVITMYATTDPVFTSRTGPAGGGATELRYESGAGGARTVLVPRPCRPLDDSSQALKHGPQAAGVARHTAQRVLASWKVRDEAADAMVLVISELVTNAVEHAEPPLALHLHRERAGGRVWVGVSDGGSAPYDQAQASLRDSDEHGRGLTIVSVLADAYGTRTHSDGHVTRWARLSAA